jgi:hypothetical protein
MGGKVHGKINVNTIQDRRVFDALFDANGGNTFGPQMNTYWSTWLGSRTRSMQTRTLPDGVTPVQVPIPGLMPTSPPTMLPTSYPTADDALGSDPNYANYDRAFKPFGVTEMSNGPVTNPTGLQDTMLRTTVGGTEPMLWDPDVTKHPYIRAEAARKILGSTTTVSNTYAVFFTVSYFEVRTDAAGNPVFQDEAAKAPYTGQYLRPLLGREAYKEVPGDIRQKFCAVVDRNNLMMNPTDNNPLGVGVAGTVTPPFFIAMEAPAAASTNFITVSGVSNTGDAYADGTAVRLINTNVVIGTGASAEVRQITGVGFNPVTGYTTLSFGPGLTYSHQSGECVSNGRLGNPGPQPSFDVMDVNSPYRQNGLVPYVGQVK